MQFTCNLYAVYSMTLWNVICKLQYYTYIQQNCGQKPKAQWNQSQKNNKNPKPKAKSQAKPKPKAKSQMGMQIGSKLQQIARKSEILAPAANTSQKPETEGARSQKPKARSQKPKARSPKKKYPSIYKSKNWPISFRSSFCIKLIWLKIRIYWKA